MNKYIAHIKTDKNKKKDLNNTHTIKEHIEGVQDIALSFDKKSKWNDYIKLASLLHDIGKYQESFQNYIRDDNGKRGSVHHAKYGAIVSNMLYKSQEVCFAVDGHHTGLKDYSELMLKYKSLDSDDKEILKEVLGLLKSEITNSVDFLSSVNFSISNYSKLEKDIITRLIFSSLVDADWLDTERFMDTKKYNLRTQKSFDIEFLSKKLEEKLSDFNENTEVNKLRNEARQEVLAKSNKRVGFFSLALPTGLGKTLTSLNWAIEHARHNNLKRIIIVLPYTSIIDQTAKTLKEMFGEEYVLEHHSNIKIKSEENDNKDTEENIENKHFNDIQKLNSENWNSPIIITTTVQFFESLFANKPSKCRKLHNIMNSVIIFDEVQVLDKGIVKPTLKMLKNMFSLFNSSFLFCTATMPAFQKRENFDGIENIIPLIENPESIFQKMKRVDYHLYNNLEDANLEELKESISKETNSTLVIVNTKSTALKLYKELETSNNFNKVIHLSTNMYPAHRKRVLSKITSVMKNSDKKILLISTQLVEAGVDLDFHTVYREIAPISSIIQAAGRCNRNGKFKTGQVYIFSLLDSNIPSGMYEIEAKETKALLKNNGVNILHKHDTFNDYYKMICDLHQKSEDTITKNREHFNFKTVAQTYRIIENNTEQLFIPVSINDNDKEVIENLIEKIDKGYKLYLEDYRIISQFSINVYENFIYKYMKEGIITEVNNILVWNGEYSKNYGIKVDEVNINYIV